jgi:hypothetical protein
MTLPVLTVYSTDDGKTNDYTTVDGVRTCMRN